VIGISPQKLSLTSDLGRSHHCLPQLTSFRAIINRSPADFAGHFVCSLYQYIQQIV
jgi:hypothetical protein